MQERVKSGTESDPLLVWCVRKSGEIRLNQAKSGENVWQQVKTSSGVPWSYQDGERALCCFWRLPQQGLTNPPIWKRTNCFLKYPPISRKTTSLNFSQVDILLVNDTEIPLLLDVDQDCQRECHHKGWQVGFVFTNFKPWNLNEQWVGTHTADQVREDCGRSGTPRGGSAILERNVLGLGKGRGSGRPVREGTFVTKAVRFGAQSFVHFSTQTQLCSKKLFMWFQWFIGSKLWPNNTVNTKFCVKMFLGAHISQPPQNALYHTVQMVLVDPCDRSISRFW